MLQAHRKKETFETARNRVRRINFETVCIGGILPTYFRKNSNDKHQNKNIKTKGSKEKKHTSQNARISAIAIHSPQAVLLYMFSRYSAQLSVKHFLSDTVGKRRASQQTAITLLKSIEDCTRYGPSQRVREKERIVGIAPNSYFHTPKQYTQATERQTKK